MKTKTVTYAMLRKTGQFENDRVEIEIELGPNESSNEDVFRAVARAKTLCEASLAMEKKVFVQYGEYDAYESSE